MKQCTSCGQITGQLISTCPSCGCELVAGMTHIDDYRIQAIIHESRASLLCKAIKKGAKKSVSIRLFTDTDLVDDGMAMRLENELACLKKLPEDQFVQHYALRKSQSGQWYRISEWVDAQDWGSIFVSGMLGDQQRVIKLFYQVTKALEILHKHGQFMPYLVLEDLLIPQKSSPGIGVKINYHTSRFLNAGSASPMVEKLQNCHPDLTQDRAVDIKTSIWSLGKVFVEVLTADDSITHFAAKVDQIQGLDPELAILIKVMLSDNPSLRPKNFGAVVGTLSKILNKLPHTPMERLHPIKKKSIVRDEKDPNRVKRLAVLLCLLLVMVAASNLSTWYYLDIASRHQAETPATFVENYADSVGFIMVEYWLTDGDKINYKNKVEGTAFLVDEAGYLLTNRHVACPWLEDASLFRVYRRAQEKERELEFHHRIFLWFEGEKAFNRLPDLQTSRDLSDSYFLSSAFRSDGKSNLRIVGVPRASGKTGEVIRSPFKHDFAVLKIDTIPEGLTPLPLAAKLDASGIQRLSPVIILGFPLGNRTQADRINVSVTRGHVRRTSSEIIQVDSSIYKGNSGGPAINKRGEVIGIASGVVTDQTSPHLPVVSPLSDFGLVLPITRPAQFMRDLKEGQIKWDGILDFSLPTKLKRVMGHALKHRFNEAAGISDVLLKQSTDPALLLSSGVLHFCNQDFDKSQERLRRLLAIEDDNATAALVLYIMDWLKGEAANKAYIRPLFKMDWQAKDEFMGYLATMLKKNKKTDPNFIEYESRSERAWRLFIDGLILEKSNTIYRAKQKYKQSILLAGTNEYAYFMASSRLKPLWDHTPKEEESFKEFSRRAERERLRTQANQIKLLGMAQRFESPNIRPREKKRLYDELKKVEPENRNIIGRIAFFYAMKGKWGDAQEAINRYFSKPSRETPLSLSLGLLKGEILKLQGRDTDALNYLNHFQSSTRSPWYGLISKHLIMGTQESELLKLAGSNPQKLITLQTALGLWAEAEEDTQKAAHHYREALSTYLDEWNEYDLALNRIIQFRKNMN